jgi:hypothetical protein
MARLESPLGVENGLGETDSWGQSTRKTLHN